jgi:sporulation protein YlmC with PRC-barrel domain
MAQPSSNTTELQLLKDTGLELATPSQDIRGRSVTDRDGTAIGHISALYIDQDERKVRMLGIRVGGFLGIGEQHVLLPVDAITSVTAHDVAVSETRAKVVGSPVYDPTLVDRPTQESWDPYYGYYGYSPYWGRGYAYPNFGMWP